MFSSEVAPLPFRIGSLSGLPQIFISFPFYVHLSGHVSDSLDTHSQSSGERTATNKSLHQIG